MLERYNRIVPGAADRILRMAETQSTHRQDLERCVIRGNVRAQMLGQAFAFILCLVLFGGGIYLLTAGREIGGLASLALAVAGLVATFIYGRTKQEKERVEKQQAVARR